MPRCRHGCDDANQLRCARNRFDTNGGMKAGLRRRSLSPRSHNIFLMVVICAAMLLVGVDGVDHCRADAIRKCQVLNFPKMDMQIIPSGVLELSGFKGTCSIECLNHLKTGCKNAPATKESFQSTCRALACWASVEKECGTEIDERACSVDCRDATTSNICKGTEEIFPEYTRYKEVMRPGSRECAAIACDKRYISKDCEGYNSETKTLPISSLCNDKCYRSLQQESCRKAKIRIQRGSTSLLWDGESPSGTPTCSILKATVSFTAIFSANVSNADDETKEGIEKLIADALDVNVPLLGGVAGPTPEIDVENVRPGLIGSSNSTGGGVAADITVTFEDSGNAELLATVLADQPGLVFGDTGDFEIKNITTGNLAEDMPHPGSEIPRYSYSLPHCCAYSRRNCCCRITGVCSQSKDYCSLK